MAETAFGLTEPDIADLYTAVSRAFTGWKAEMLLRAVTIDPDHFANFDRDAEQTWADVFKTLRAGEIADPYRALLRAAPAERPHQDVLGRLAVDGLPAAQAADIDAVRERRPSVLRLACHTSLRPRLFERADGQWADLADGLVVIGTRLP